MDRKPYLLQPDRPAEGEPRPLRDGETETEVSAAWQERARQLNLVMRRPQLSPRTQLAHEATAYAKEKGLDGNFHHAAARAYWERGVDLNDTQVLRQLSQEAGLDWSDLAPRLESGQYREEVVKEYEAAKEKGVGGTPTYMIGGEIVFGDLSLDDLRNRIRASSASGQPAGPHGMVTGGV